MGDDELFVWLADAGGTIRATEPAFVRLCGADPTGQPLARLAAPLPPLEPAAATIEYTAADGSRFAAMTFSLPVGGGALGVGVEPAGTFVETVAARRRRPAPGDTALRELLGRIGANLDKHAALAATFNRRSDFVEELAEEIRLFSLNAILAAHRVADAAAIGAVAQLMQTRSDAAGPEILALRGAIDETGALLEGTRFRVAAAELLAEALLVHPDVPLAEPLADTVEAAITSLAALEGALDRLAKVSQAVDEHLKMLRFLELQGRIEAARAHDTEHVRTLFDEIGVHVRKAGAELQEFAALATRRNRHDAAVGREARRLVSRIASRATR
jgi:hypothetical protein